MLSPKRCDRWFDRDWLLNETYRPCGLPNSENRCKADNRINRESSPILQLPPILSRLPLVFQTGRKMDCGLCCNCLSANRIHPQANCRTAIRTGLWPLPQKFRHSFTAVWRA